jgi:hypothetical protein
MSSAPKLDGLHLKHLASKISKYSKLLKKMTMNWINWLQIALLFITNIVAVISIHWNKEFRDSKFLKFQKSHVLIILILMSLAISILIVWQQENELNANKIQLEHDRKVAAIEGTLTPDLSAGKILSTKEDIYPAIEIGHSGFIAKSDEMSSIIRHLKGINLNVTEEHGQIMVSAIIRGKDGSFGKIENNDWGVNTGPFFRNYNNSALEILDKDEDVVFWIHLLSDRVQMQGTLINETGFGISFGDNSSLGDPSPEKGLPNKRYGKIIIFGNHTNYSGLKFKKVFKYPSGLNLGKLAD